MPIVPTATSPSIAPADLPGVQLQAPYHIDQHATEPGRELSSLGQGAMRFGDDMLGIQTQQQIGLNEAAVKDYDTKLIGSIQGVLYGTPDNPDAGYMAQKGKTAVDAYDATTASLQGLGDKLASNLQNPAQQELAKSYTAMRVQAAMTQAAQHRDQQQTVYQKTASDVRIKTAQEAAPLAYNPLTDTPGVMTDDGTPDANSQYQQYLRTAKAEALDQADRLGLPADVGTDMANNAVARAYTLTLAHLIDRQGGNPADLKIAQSYFDQVKADLPSDVQDKVRALLEAGATKDKALNVALDVKSSVAGINAQEKELDQRFQNGDINADVHDAALQKLRADNSQRRSEQSESDKAILGQVWDMANKGGTITDLTPSQYNYVKTRGLGSSVDAMFKRAGAVDFDDSKQYSDLMRMSAEDPAGFANMDLATMTGALTKQHWNHLLDRQTSINRGDARALDVMAVQKQALGDMTAQMKSAGLNTAPKPGTDAAQQLDQFTSSLHDALATAQTDWQTKKFTRAQMRDDARTITLGMLKDQALSGTGYFGSTVGETHMPIWKMSPEQRGAPWDIPDTDRQQITQALQHAGKPASEDAIQGVYKRAQGMR